MAFPYVPNYSGDWKNFPDVTTPITEAALDNLETQFQSVLDLLTTRGDLPFRGAATWERLAKGTTGQYLRQSANDPYWDTPIATGNYTGNASNNRQITVGFKCSLVIVIANAAGSLTQDFLAIAIPNISTKLDSSPSMVVPYTALVLHGTDGFEVDENHANETGGTYYYWALADIS